jgi:hypothetical protein
MGSGTRGPACGRARQQALETEADRPFSDRIAEPEPTPTLGQVRRPFGCGDRASEVPEAVLPKLRDLDPRVDRDGAAARREVVPGRCRFLVATHPSEEPRALDRHPLRCPRRIEPTLDDPRPGRSATAATNVGDSARMPPRLRHRCEVIVVRVWIPRRDGRHERGIEAGKGIVQPALASECPSEAGEVAPRSLFPGGRVRVVDVDSDEQPRE